VHMVGATPAAAAAIVNGCTLMATNPTLGHSSRAQHSLENFFGISRGSLSILY
jgi:hypothetical protein